MASLATIVSTCQWARYGVSPQQLSRIWGIPHSALTGMCELMLSYRQELYAPIAVRPLLLSYGTKYTYLAFSRPYNSTDGSRKGLIATFWSPTHSGLKFYCYALVTHWRYPALTLTLRGCSFCSSDSANRSTSVVPDVLSGWYMDIKWVS